MKKIISSLLCVAMLLSIAVSALSINVSAAEKKEIAVKWNVGYAAISPNNAYNLTSDYVKSASYSVTDIFTVPKAGTIITWTDDAAAFASNSVAVVSNWKQVGNEWVIDNEKPMFVGAQGKYNSMIESPTLSGSNVTSITYTYITDTDNEMLRICAAGDSSNIKVYAEEANIAESSWDKALAMYPAEPSAPISAITGAPVDAEILKDELIWKYGHIGSATHPSHANTIKVAGTTYVYSSVFTVPKAGTTVYFFDDSVADAEGGTYASSNAAAFSFWKKSGSEWVFDTSKPSIDAADANQKILGDYKIYWYTTTSDNENIRITYRAGIGDYSLPIRPYNIYLEAPISFNKVTSTGVLTNTSYKDSTGKDISYKIYLPDGFEEGSSVKILFNIGNKTDVVDALVADKTNTVIVSFDGSDRDAEKLIDAVVKSYDLNQYFMYLIGSEGLVSSIGKAFANAVKSTDVSSPALDAGKALLSVQPNYYGILDGITMYAMGDSYFGGSTLGKSATWVNGIGEKYSMHYVNYGIGGSTMSNLVTSETNPMVDRFMNMESGNADVILLEGGRNDRSKLVPIGSFDSKDSKTFLGSINIMLDSMLQKYPNALIILVTAWYHTGKASSGLSNVDYANAMRDLAAYRNDPRVICLYAADPEATGINMDDANFRAQYCTKPTDVSHLNVEGMKMIQPFMEKFIATELAKFRSLNLDGTDPNATTPPTVDTEAPSDDTTELQGTVTEAPVTKKSCGNFTALSYVAVIVVSAFGFALTVKKKF